MIWLTVGLIVFDVGLLAWMLIRQSLRKLDRWWDEQEVIDEEW